MLKDFVDKDWDWKRKLECIREIDPNFGPTIRNDPSDGKNRYWALTRIMVSYDGVNSKRIKSTGHDSEEEMVDEWFHYLAYLGVGGRVITHSGDQYSYNPYNGKFMKLSPEEISSLNNDYLTWGNGEEPSFELNTARSRKQYGQLLKMGLCLHEHGTLVPPEPKAEQIAKKVVSVVGTGIACACGVILAALGLATWRSGRSK